MFLFLTHFAMMGPDGKIGSASGCNLVYTQNFLELFRLFRCIPCNPSCSQKIDSASGSALSLTQGFSWVQCHSCCSLLQLVMHSFSVAIVIVGEKIGSASGRDLVQMQNLLQCFCALHCHIFIFSRLLHHLWVWFSDCCTLLSFPLLL